mgnify:CR=1 FL=1
MQAIGLIPTESTGGAALAAEVDDVFAVSGEWAGDATVHDPGCIADFAGGCAPSCWGLQPWPDPRPLVERQIKALGGAARGGRRARRLRREDS